MRRNNEAEMTIVEQLLKIKEETCEYACGWMENLKMECGEDDVLYKVHLQQYCQRCPLNKIHIEVSK